ncbi:hypothetical protein COCOBI_12-2190 [Coccomyxa sp. Obi]|nr:hypothetical protein COCOBI_12-2190 [Coccomyxa sp. Obi]
MLLKRETSATNAYGGDEQEMPPLPNRPFPLPPPLGLPPSVHAGLEPPGHRGVPSLQSLCLGCLATYLEDLLDAGQELLSQLPWTWKAPLLAVARRTGMLTDHALLLLLDEDFVSLDLAHARRVTRNSVAEALRQLPLLRALDLSHAAFQPASLASLAQTCPLLEVLRLGGLPPKSVRAAADALLRCLPRLQQTAVADSWEDLAEPSAPQAERGLERLEYLVWPDISAEALAHLHAHQPQLKIIGALDHPLLRPARRHRPPPAADPRVPLDQPHADAVAQFDWDAAAARAHGSGLVGFSGAAGPEGAAASEGGAGAGAGGRRELTLAERFRLAYESRAARVAVVRAKNAKKEQRRALRAMGSAERAVALAEHGVPLVQKRSPGKPR